MILFNPMHVIWKTSFLTIYSWGLMFIVAFIIAGLLFYLEARKKGVSQDTVLKILLLILIGAIVGGRLFFVLENLSVFIAKPLSIFAYGLGGETSYGGIILAVLFVWLYLRKNKEINFSQVLDMTAPYLALGLAIARIGCFLNWDDFGIQSTLPWAIKVGNDIARHPTQLYELIYCGIIFGLLIWFKKIKTSGKESGFKRMLNKPGAMFLIFLILYSVFRFFNDFLRVYEHYWLGMATSQWLLILTFVASVLILIFEKKD